MTCVVDASVALKWFLSDEPYATEALTLARTGEILIAPDLLIVETCNGAWIASVRGRIAPAELQNIATVLPRVFAELLGAPGLAPRATGIAAELRHPVYDCFYLALAEMRQLPLVTADARFLARLAGSRWAANAVHLSDYQPRR